MDRTYLPDTDSPRGQRRRMAATISAFALMAAAVLVSPALAGAGSDGDGTEVSVEDADPTATEEAATWSPTWRVRALSATDAELWNPFEGLTAHDLEPPPPPRPAAKAPSKPVVTRAAVSPAPAPAPPPPPPPSSGDDVWYRLAQCESGGNWGANTGNGYYGGLQFSLSSWQGVGGSGYPHEHPASVQIEMGKRLQAQQGWGAWPHCSRKLGLR